MKRIFIAMVAVVLAAGLTPASAAGMHGVVVVACTLAVCMPAA